MLVVLTRFDEYTFGKTGIIARKGEPVDVPETEAKSFLSKGYGMKYEESEGILSIKNFDISQTDSPPPEVINEISEDDDLNNKVILLRRAGGAIGDAVFVASVAEVIRDKWPESHIIMSVREANDMLNMVPLAEMFQAIDKVVGTQEGHSFSLISRCDYVLDFTGTIEGNKNAEKSDYYRLQFERAGMDWAEYKPVQFTFDEATTDAYNNWLAGCSLREGEYTIVFVGGSGLLKKYPDKNWKTIAESVASGDNEECVLMGGLRDTIPHTDHPRIRFAFGIDLKLSVRIICGAKAFIGVDTGMLHIAGNAGVPTLSLWGFTSPDHTIPNYQNAVTITSPTNCSPCHLDRPSWCHKAAGGIAQCMKEIAPLSVLAELKNLNVSSSKYLPTVQRGKVQPTEAIVGRDKIVIDKTQNNILMILDRAGTYTGGGYYMYSLANALSRCTNTTVWLYCDCPPVYRNDFEPSDRLRIAVDSEFTNFKTLVPPNFDLVIGCPHTPGIMAIDYAHNYGVKSSLVVFETPNFIREYRDGIDGEDSFWNEYRDALLNADSIIAISRTTRDRLHEWEPKLADDKTTYILRPCVNEFSYSKVSESDRERAVAVIARGMWYKGVKEALKVISKIPDPPKVYLIGDRVSNELNSYGAVPMEVELKENIPDVEKFLILKKVKCLLFLSDFEGFGIPPAEALMCGTPVVAKPLEVLMDNYKRHVKFPAKQRLYRAVKNLVDCKYDSQEGESAHKYARQYFSENRLKASVRKFVKREGLKKEVQHVEVGEDRDIRLGMVTSWNTRCGIAENTKYFVDKLNGPVQIFAPEDDVIQNGKDPSNVYRCWDRRFMYYGKLLDAVLARGINVLHIQHEFSFFGNNTNMLIEFINKVRAKGVSVVTTVHTYRPDVRFFTDLNTVCNAVTSPKTDLGNMELIPLPIPQFKDVDKNLAKKEARIAQETTVIGMFGFWQAHKGYREVIQCMPEFITRFAHRGKTKLMIQGQCDHRNQHATESRRTAKQQGLMDNMVFYNDYPPLENCVRRMQACDVLLFNYLIQGYWSSSAAIRTAMSTHRPVVASRCLMFQELEDRKQVVKFRYEDQEDMVEKVGEVVNDGNLAHKVVTGADSYVSNCSPEKVARKYEAVYRRISS